MARQKDSDRENEIERQTRRKILKESRDREKDRKTGDGLLVAHLTFLHDRGLGIESAAVGVGYQCITVKPRERGRPPLDAKNNLL